MDATGDGTLMLISWERHMGDFSLDADKNLMIQGGWYEAFKNQNGTTALKGAPKAPQGWMLFQNLRIVP